VSSVDIERDALTFIGAVCADTRQATHIMRIVASITPGGVAQVDSDQADGLMGLARAGLRADKIVTPVDTIFCIGNGRMGLTSLGAKLLEDME